MTYKRELATPISVRLPRETKARLEQLAEEKHMELSPFVVAIIEDWLKMRKEIGENAMNWHTYINNSEYKEAMQTLIRDTFLDSVINTPNYRDNIKDVVKRVLSEASEGEGRFQTRKKK
jgi:predicted transcriptional regulator